MIRIIQDGNNLAYMCNVTTELYTKQGERTSAIVGVLNATRSNIEKLSELLDNNVCEIIFAWDKGHSKRRVELYPEYKANRHKERTEEEEIKHKEFIEQANVLADNLHLFGIKCIKEQGWEADDIVAVLVKEMKKRYPKDTIVICSTDEDYHQLIDDNVCIYSPIKEVLYTKENYKELKEIDVKYFIDYKIMKGDSSDNIRGIDGIGEKTAKSLINKYGGINEILAHREELIKSKRTEKIFTNEGLNILLRNNRLINLGFVDSSEIQENIFKILDEYPIVDTKLARNFLIRYQITSILVKWQEWIETFTDVEENFDNDIPF